MYGFGIGLNPISNPSDENGTPGGDIDAETKELFLPYRVYCTRKDVSAQFLPTIFFLLEKMLCLIF